MGCGATGYLEAYHRTPRWAGGSDNPELNSQLLCERCHRIKTAWQERARRLGQKWPRLRVVLIVVVTLIVLAIARSM